MRSITAVFNAPRPHWVGDGFPVRSLLSHHEHGTAISPFLLLDYAGPYRFESARQRRGVGEHPHRGFETVTIVYSGEVEHRDSSGGGGIIGPGDVQWMTAGSGIIHQEMPHGDAQQRMGGFQLWANLPASHKMMDPRYDGIGADQIPVHEAGGARLRVVAGAVGDVRGPVGDIVIDPEYFDVALQGGVTWTHATAPDHTAFAYLFEGEARFGEAGDLLVADPGMLVLLGAGDTTSVTAGASGARLLYISGKPLGEPVAWRGPIVMNTREELDVAWQELEAGTFVKHAASDAAE